MRNGLKIYLKHSVLMLALIIITFVTEGRVSVFFILITSIYFWLFYFGAFLTKGPLKSVGLELLRDRKEEIEESQPKQPWE